MRRLLKPLRLLRKVSWLAWVVFVLVGVAMVLIAVPGHQVAASDSDLQWFYQEATNPRVQREVDLRYPNEELGSGEAVLIDQYRHGWPLPCLDRGLGRVVLLTKTPGSYGVNEVFVRGHPRTEPLLSVQLPGEHDSFSFKLQASGTSYAPVHQPWVTVPIRWSNYNRWPLASDAAVWRPGALLVDLLVCLAIPLAAAGLTQWWVLRRGGALRFRLVDLLVAVTLCCAALAWRQSHVHLRGVEQQVEANARPLWFVTQDHLRDSWERRQRGEWENSHYARKHSGPDWLSRLLGNEDFFRSTKHLAELRLVPDNSWRENLDLLPELPYLESVSFPRGVTRRAVDCLAKAPRLRELSLGVSTPELRTNFERRTVVLAGERLLSAQDLGLLASLPIRELGLLGEEVLAGDLEPILAMPTLERLELVDCAVTWEQIVPLRKKYPKVEIECEWGHPARMTRWSTRQSYEFNGKQPYGLERRIEKIKQRRAAVSGEENR